MAVFLLVAILGTGLLMLQRPQHTSSASVFLLPRSGGAAGQLAAAQEYAITQSKTFATLGSSPVVLEPVHRKLELNKIKTSGGRYGYAYGYGGYSYEYGSQGSGNGKRGARAAAKRGRGARKSGGSRRAR